MTHQNLTNFSQDWPGTIVQADVHVSESLIDISYAVQSPKPVLIPPMAETPQFRKGLWQHTCFEFFVRPSPMKNYLEFNFSPSGDWAVFAFSGYRTALKEFDPTGMVVGVRRELTKNGLHVEATIDRAAMHHHFQQDKTWEFRCGLTAVLESHDKKLTYWALAHGKVKPDFHLPETFILPLQL